MTVSGLRLVDEDAQPPRAEPNVLVRTLVVPPGAPWVQQRAAMLEARHSAPLPIESLVLSLMRLEGWRPGRPGRYAACYVLARDFAGRLTTTVEIEERALRVAFLSPELQRAQARQLAMAALVLGAAAFILITAVGSAFVRRADAEAGLQAIETRAAAKLRAAETRERLDAQDRALAARLDRGGTVRAVVADLSWASRSKAPDAHLEGLHWEPSLLAVEVRGGAAPFQSSDGRTLRKAPKPVRKGVWLWGVSPRPTAGLTDIDRTPRGAGEAP